MLRRDEEHIVPAFSWDLNATEEEGLGINVSIHRQREDLAQIVGTATESLIRTLSDFKSEKLIDIREGKVFILDEEKLKNMLN